MFSKFMNKKVSLTIASSVCASFISPVSAQESAAPTNSLTTIQTDFFAKENWGVSYMNYMNGPTSETQGSSINHYLTLKRKFNPDWSLSLTARPDSNFDNGEPSYVMSDPFLKLNYPTIYKNDNGFKLSGDIIYYAPLSDKSKVANTSGTISPRLTATYEAGNFNFLYLMYPKIYLNKETKDGQKIFFHGHYLSTSYKLNSTVSLDFAVYPSWTYMKNKEGTYEMPGYPGLTINVNKDISISPYVEVSMLKPDSKTSSVGGVFNYTML